MQNSNHFDLMKVFDSDLQTMVGNQHTECFGLILTFWLRAVIDDLSEKQEELILQHLKRIGLKVTHHLDSGRARGV